MEHKSSIFFNGDVHRALLPDNLVGKLYREDKVSGVSVCWNRSGVKPTISTFLAAGFPAVIMKSVPQSSMIFGGISRATDNTTCSLETNKLKHPQKEHSAWFRTKDGTITGCSIVPFLEKSGFLKKTSRFSILPNSWRRSRPVAWFSSVGTDPSLAPSP